LFQFKIRPRGKERGHDQATTKPRPSHDQSFLTPIDPFPMTRRPPAHKSPFEVQSERKAKRFYIGLVVLLFAIQCTILGTAIKLAIGDPSLAVVPDYHQAALNWDDAQVAARAAGRLGWDWKLDVSDVADGKGLRAIEFRVLDRDGSPMSDLNVRGKVYHHTQANQVDRFEFQNVGEGRYMAMPRMSKDGLWQIELDLSNAGEPMSFKRTIELHG